MPLQPELSSHLRAIKELLGIVVERRASTFAEQSGTLEVQNAAKHIAKLQNHLSAIEILTVVTPFRFGHYEAVICQITKLLKDEPAPTTYDHLIFTNALGMKMKWCPPGEFVMGSPNDEEGRHYTELQVHTKISKGFWMSATTVTQGQWKALMGYNRSKFTGNTELPVESVAHIEDINFCTKLSIMKGHPNKCCYALPTEAQWEYACRAGTKSPFHYGVTLTSYQANFVRRAPYSTETYGPYLEKTCPVGSYAPNNWGLYDMHGNVFEWCADLWNGENTLSGGVDPARGVGLLARFMSECGRVVRGGSWESFGVDCRSASRIYAAPGMQSMKIGFRVIATS